MLPRWRTQTLAAMRYTTAKAWTPSRTESSLSVCCISLGGTLTWPDGHGYIANMSRMAAGKFKDKCLKVLDQVASTRAPVTITKRGKPVAMVVPYKTPRHQAESLAGSIVKEIGDPFGTGEKWDADLP
jgi:prevent-host-death family protein